MKSFVNVASSPSQDKSAPVVRWGQCMVLQLLLMSLSGISTASADAAVDCVDLLYFLRPPYYQVDAQGKVGGLVAGQAARIFRQAGICYHWHELPANRHLRWIRETHRPACAVGWFKNRAREQFAQFSLPIYQDQPLVVVSRRDSGLKKYYPAAANLLRQKSLTLGLPKGFSYGPYLDAEIVHWQTPTYETNRPISGLLEMLERKRFDYVFMAQEEADYLQHNTTEPKLVSILIGDLPKGNQRYLLCSKNLDAGSLDKLNAEIRSQ